MELDSQWLRQQIEKQSFKDNSDIKSRAKQIILKHVNNLKQLCDDGDQEQQPKTQNTFSQHISMQQSLQVPTKKIQDLDNMEKHMQLNNSEQQKRSSLVKNQQQPKEQIEQFLENCIVQDNTKNDILYNYQEKCNNVYLLLKGTVGVWEMKTHTEVNKEIEIHQQLSNQNKMLSKSGSNYENILTQQKIDQLQKDLDVLRNKEDDQLLKQEKQLYFITPNITNFKRSSVLNPGSLIGEMQAFSMSKMQKVYICLSDCEFLKIESKIFSSIFDAGIQKLNFIKETLEKHFPQAHSDCIQSLVFQCEEVFYSKGEVIFEEGVSFSTFLYLIKKGEVKLQTKAVQEMENHTKVRCINQQKQLDLALVAEGNLFGFEDLLETQNEIRNYTAISCTLPHCQLFKFSKKVIENVINRFQDQGLSQSFKQLGDVKQQFIKLRTLNVIQFSKFQDFQKKQSQMGYSSFKSQSKLGSSSQNSLLLKAFIKQTKSKRSKKNDIDNNNKNNNNNDIDNSMILSNQHSDDLAMAQSIPFKKGAQKEKSNDKIQFNSLENMDSQYSNKLQQQGSIQKNEQEIPNRNQNYNQHIKQYLDEELENKYFSNTQQNNKAYTLPLEQAIQFRQEVKNAKQEVKNKIKQQYELAQKKLMLVQQKNKENQEEDLFNGLLLGRQKKDIKIQQSIDNNQQQQQLKKKDPVLNMPLNSKNEQKIEVLNQLQQVTQRVEIKEKLKSDIEKTLNQNQKQMIEGHNPYRLSVIVNTKPYQSQQKVLKKQEEYKNSKEKYQIPQTKNTNLLDRYMEKKMKYDKQQQMKSMSNMDKFFMDKNKMLSELNFQQKSGSTDLSQQQQQLANLQQGVYSSQNIPLKHKRSPKNSQSLHQSSLKKYIHKKRFSQNFGSENQEQQTNFSQYRPNHYTNNNLEINSQPSIHETIQSNKNIQDEDQKSSNQSTPRSIKIQIQHCSNVSTPKQVRIQNSQSPFNRTFRSNFYCKSSTMVNSIDLSPQVGMMSQTNRNHLQTSIDKNIRQKFSSFSSAVAFKEQSQAITDLKKRKNIKKIAPTPVSHRKNNSVIKQRTIPIIQQQQLQKNYSAEIHNIHDKYQSHSIDEKQNNSLCLRVLNFKSLKTTRETPNKLRSIPPIKATSTTTNNFNTNNNTFHSSQKFDKKHFMTHNHFLRKSIQKKLNSYGISNNGKKEEEEIQFDKSLQTSHNFRTSTQQQQSCMKNDIIVRSLQTKNLLNGINQLVSSQKSSKNMQDMVQNYPEISQFQTGMTNPHN